MYKPKTIHIIISIFLSLILVLSTTVISFGEILGSGDIKVDAKAACVFNADGSTMLYDKNAHKKMYPASCTKIMTALLVLENCDDLSETVTVSREALSITDPESNEIGLEVGERLSVNDLLNALILRSANDAANVLAEYVGGSVENFVEMMNDKVKELGLTETRFTNPHGLFDENHYTSAYDLAMITAEATENEDFMELIGTHTYTIKATNKTNYPRVLYNQHIMSEGHAAHDEDIIGGKNGFVRKAKCNLVTVARTNGMTLVFVTLKGDSYSADAADTQKLLNYCRKNYRQVNLPIDIKEISTDKLKNLAVYTEENVIHATLNKKQDEKDLTTSVQLVDDLSLPIKKDQMVGVAMAKVGDEVQGITLIRSAESKPTFHVSIISAIMLTFTALLLLLLWKRKKKASFR